MQLVRRGVQPRDQRRLPEPRPTAEPRERVGRHQHRRRKMVGKLLDTAAARLSRLLQMLGRHRVPGQDVKQLVRQIEMTPTLHLVACDQHRVELRQTACRAGDPPIRVDHENQDAQLPFHDFRKARRRRIAETELRNEPFPGAHRVLEARAPAKTEHAAHERRLAPDLGRQGAVRGNPAARPAFTGFQPLHVDTGLTPGEQQIRCGMQLWTRRSTRTERSEPIVALRWKIVR